MADIAGRRDTVAAKLDTCIVLTEHQTRSPPTERGHADAAAQRRWRWTLNLADSVDSALYVSDELGCNTVRARHLAWPRASA
jgi:hypothetical protein